MHFTYRGFHKNGYLFLLMWTMYTPLGCQPKIYKFMLSNNFSKHFSVDSGSTPLADATVHDTIFFGLFPYLSFIVHIFPMFHILMHRSCHILLMICQPCFMLPNYFSHLLHWEDTHTTRLFLVVGPLRGWGVAPP